MTGIGFRKKFEEAEPFYRAQGLEIATFLVNFATERGIPLADPNGHTGGIALIGWSLGGIHATALLAYLDELPQDTRSTLQKYLHTVLFHGETRCSKRSPQYHHTDSLPDASSVALGIPSLARHNNIGLWSLTDDRKRLDVFFDWATAHYVHKSVVSDDIDDLEFDKPSDIPRSLHELSYEQRAKYTDLNAFSTTGCDGKLLFCDPTAFALLTKRALFDKARAQKFPDVRVRFMSSGTTAGMLVWTVWIFRKYVENPPEGPYGSDAEKARDIKFVTQTEGNHFVFWEDPEKAIQQYSVVINL